MNAALSSTKVPDFLKLLAHELRWKILTALAYSDRSAQEIVQFLHEPQNVVSYHLRKLREQALVKERRSNADERSLYYSLDLEQFRTLYLLAPFLGAIAGALVYRLLRDVQQSLEEETPVSSSAERENAQ